MLIAVLFTIAKKWKQLNVYWQMNTYGLNGILLRLKSEWNSDMQYSVEDTRISEISQTQKDKLYDPTYMRYQE